MAESPASDLLDTLQSDDGTILPRTVAPTTGERALLGALPRLDRDGVTSDLVLLETIGKGGMGVVRIAEQRGIGRRVAVKQLVPDRRGDPSAVLYLLREAWVTGALEHPNVIPIHGIGADADGGPLIVMKRVEGQAWSAILREGGRDLRWHLRVLMQVASAVDFAASRGIVHRDLKPDNVMIGSFGEVYVLDWGIAVSVADDHGGRVPLAREVDGIAGTPGYMAPEMVEARGERLGPRTDVFLLGAVLHELITKERRHQGSTVQSILLAAVECRPFAYSSHLPPELVAIVERATAKDPEGRFATAGELREAIERFLEHESSRELVDQAELRLTAWVEAGESARAVDVQRYFGEARFAFLQALRAWPDNTHAREGLTRALRLKIAHDLARDDLEAATVALEELGDDRALAAQIEELRGRVEARRAELGGLRRLQAARDLDVGRRTRARLVTVSALTFGLAPPLGWLLGFRGEAGYPFFYASAAVRIVGGLVLARWAWATLSRTAVDRQLTVAVQLMMFAELGILAFTESLGRPVENGLHTTHAVYFLVTTTLAITIDLWLLGSALLYVLGASLALLWLDGVHWVLGATHLGAGLFAAALWNRPRPTSS